VKITVKNRARSERKKKKHKNTKTKTRISKIENHKNIEAQVLASLRQGKEEELPWLRRSAGGTSGKRSNNHFFT
jgi:hypothetical protein